MDNVKTGSTSGTIATRDLPDQKVGLTVLRARFLNSATAMCEGGKRVGTLGRAGSSHITFATVTATCSGDESEDKDKEDTVFYLGTAVKDGREWTFSFRCPRDDFARNEQRYFIPMLRTLHVYKPA